MCKMFRGEDLARTGLGAHAATLIVPRETILRMKARSPQFEDSPQTKMFHVKQNSDNYALGVPINLRCPH
jgi:hypothetical protein